MSLEAVPALIRVLVVDDERAARRGMSALLSADPEVQVVAECANGPEAVTALRQHAVDLVFLDVQMPGMDGFQVLREARPERAAIVFVTAHDTYALKAFEVHALDYLLKPFDDERFARVLARAKEHVRGGRIQALARQLSGLLGPLPAAAPAPSPSPGPRYLERLAIKKSGHVSFLPIEKVDWLEADDYYVQVHTGGQSHLVRYSLRELEAQLDPRQFLRIHRSTIVNVERVKELQPLFHGEFRVVLHDGTCLKLSRSFRERLDALLGKR